MTETKKRWLIALAYVIVIYATLGAVRAPVNYLRSHGVLRLTLYSIYGIFLFGISFYLIKNRPHPWWRYISFLFLAAIYTAAIRVVKIPEEQIHFVQYGLVGIFFFRALDLSQNSIWKNFLLSLLLSILAGWLDEIIQGLLPTRHYDVRDIVLNAVSAFLGLLVYTLLARKNGTNINRL